MTILPDDSRPSTRVPINRRTAGLLAATLGIGIMQTVLTVAYRNAVAITIFAPLALLAGLCWHVARRASMAEAEHQRQQEHLEHQAIELEEQAVELEEQVEALVEANAALLAAEAATARAHRAALEEAAERVWQTELFEAALRTVPIAMAIIDPELRYIKVNAACAAMTGQEVDAHPGRSLREVNPLLALELETAMRDVLATGEPCLNYRLSRPTPHAKRGAIEIVMHITAFRDTNGAIAGICSTATDMTAWKILQEQFFQAQKLDAVGKLAAGIAHDFNNLLSVILGWTGMVLDELPADHAVRPSLEEVVRAGQGAAGLTRQLLAFSRQQLVEPTLFNPNALVLELDKMFRRLIGEHIQFATRTEPDLGAVRMDRGQLEQVLVNLVVNARDAMPEGGRITIETANVALDADYPRTHQGVTPGEYVMIAVSDSGTGMSDEVKTRLFEPFFTTKETGKGTGLGLATSYGIAQQAGGHIEVYSEPGVGTTMKVCLPRRDEAAAIASARVERSSSRGSETILLVEDEPAVRLVSARMLETRGYRVLLANTGEEALRLLEAAREPVHLLLTDVVLAGGMNGRVLAERVRALRPGFKVLFVSGYTSDVTILHGLLEKGITLVQKPFTAGSLGGKVREVLDAE